MTKTKDLSFSEQCYAALKRVPKGRVTTYKELARAVKTKAYRAVGTAMKNNPYAPKVPCHRVVQSNGQIGGFMYGTAAKVKLLKGEGVKVANGKVVDFDKKLFIF